MTRLTLEHLEARETPAVASSGGVVFFLDDATGATTGRFVIDDGFTGPLFVAGLPGGDILIGAGTGGGPRVVRYDPTRTAEVWSVFVGDPDSRTGVSVAAWESYRSPLRAEAHPTRPGDVTGVQRQLDQIPDGIAGYLASTGFKVLVFAAPGGLTTLPEFAALAGQPVGQPGTGGLLWDDVLAATERDATYIRADQADRVIREVGIGLYDRLTASERADWLAVHAATAWVDDSLRLVPQEGFAEAFGWWVRSGRDTGGFFGRLAVTAALA